MMQRNYPYRYHNPNPDCHLFAERHPEMTLGELGLVNEIVSAAGDAASIILRIFKKPPADIWTVWGNNEKTTYINQALPLATASVLTGKAYSVENTLRKLIAHVSVNYSWEKWKKKNSNFLPALWEAENEVKHYKQYGYRPDMVYINPQVIERVSHPATASFLGGNTSTLLIIAALTIAGGIYYYKNNQQIQKVLPTKKLS